MNVLNIFLAKVQIVIMKSIVCLILFNASLTFADEIVGQCVAVMCYCGIHIENCSASSTPCIKACGDEGTLSGSTGYDSSDPWYRLGEEMGKAFRCMFGDCPEADQQRLIEKQERARKQFALLQRIQKKKLELERREKAREERQLREFQGAKARMLVQMRGGLTGELKPRNLGSTLQVVERRKEEDIFGVSMLVPRNITSFSERMTIDAKYHCVSLLLQKSSEAAAVGIFKEAYFLSKEANNLTSARGSVNIECPEVPDIIELPAISDRKQQSLKKQTFVASNILGKIAQQLTAYRVVENSITQAEENVENAKLQVETRKVKLEQLQLLDQPIVKETSEGLTIGVTKLAVEAEPRSALEIALQALELATNVFTKNEDELKKLNSEKEKAKRQIVESRHLLAQATRDPNMLNTLYDEYRAEAIAKPESED